MAQCASEEATKFATSVSWALMLAAVVFLAFLAWYIPADRRAVLADMRRFHAPISELTRLILQVPDATFPFIAVVLAAALVVVQLRARNAGCAAAFHAVVIVLCSATLVAYREAMIQPMLDVIRMVTGPHGAF